MKEDFIIHVDGHTREDQRFGVYGFTVRENGELLDARQGYLGKGISNYQAEYQVLLKSLKYIKEKLDTKNRKIRVFLDSSKVYTHCTGKRDGESIENFTDNIEGKVQFNKTTGKGMRNAHLLCSSQYSYLHPFPGYIRDLEPEELIT